MKILITGAAGFIGFHFSKFLIEKEYQVVGLDSINSYYSTKLKYDRLSILGIENINTSSKNRIDSVKFENFKFYKADLRDLSTLKEIFQNEKFDVVFNLAAQAGVRNSLINPSEYIDSNISGFLNILESCKEFKCQKLFYASSSSVYGKNVQQPFSESDKVDFPLNIYAVTKRTNELMAFCYSDLYQIKTIGLRFFTVYGPWGRPDMAPILFAKSILKNQKINIFNNGQMKRDFTYVDDIVFCMFKLLNKVDDLSINELINIGNSRPINLDYFITLLGNNLNKNVEKNYLPMQLGDVKSTWANTSKISNIIEYSPDTKIENGVKFFSDWIKEYGIDNL